MQEDKAVDRAWKKESAEDDHHARVLYQLFRKRDRYVTIVPQSVPVIATSPAQLQLGLHSCLHARWAADLPGLVVELLCFGWWSFLVACRHQAESASQAAAADSADRDPFPSDSQPGASSESAPAADSALAESDRPADLSDAWWKRVNEARPDHTG